jgi:hypothetical protein
MPTSNTTALAALLPEFFLRKCLHNAAKMLGTPPGTHGGGQPYSPGEEPPVTRAATVLMILGWWLGLSATG